LYYLLTTCSFSNFFLLLTHPPPNSTLFPYTTLFRSSRFRTTLLMAADSCAGSRSERTARYVWLDGDCRMGRNSAGSGSSVRLLYFPSSTMPTTWMRAPSFLLKYLPMAFAADPKTLCANSWLTTATGGAFLSSCQVKVLPDSKAVLAAWKYSGEMLNV